MKPPKSGGAYAPGPIYANTPARGVYIVQGPRQEFELMGSKPFDEIENYLILVPFSVKMRVST